MNSTGEEDIKYHLSTVTNIQVFGTNGSLVKSLKGLHSHREGTLASVTLRTVMT